MNGFKEGGFVSPAQIQQMKYGKSVADQMFAQHDHANDALNYALQELTKDMQSPMFNSVTNWGDLIKEYEKAYEGIYSHTYMNIPYKEKEPEEWL